MPLTTESALRKDKTNSCSSMEHRHFATVAGILAGLKPHGVNRHELHEWKHIVVGFADALRHTNPRFDRKRFLLACGMPE